MIHLPLLGAIAGDVIGSVYEFNPTKNYNFPLFDERMSYTDDTIMTIAVAAWLAYDEKHSKDGLIAWMRRLGRSYPNPMGGYGASFSKWLFQEDTAPYNSWGNGSAMRVSPVGFAADTLENALALARTTAEVTHNHPEGIKGAQAVAAAVYLARRGAGKEEIRNFVSREFGYNLLEGYAAIKRDYHFNESCQLTVPQSLTAFFESTGYEDAIRLTVALGGDADTMGAITGAVATAFYKRIPDEIGRFVTERLPRYFLQIMLHFDSYCRKCQPQEQAPTGIPSAGFRRTTPEHIDSLQPNEIFVFGSNRQGMHGGGAARTALKKFGARMGVGSGLQGHSYAIPTMHGGPEAIRPYVDAFIEFARTHPSLTFLVTRIGCGIAGYKDSDIAPLFAQALNTGNIVLPASFVAELSKNLSH